MGNGHRCIAAFAKVDDCVFPSLSRALNDGNAWTVACLQEEA